MCLKFLTLHWPNFTVEKPFVKYCCVESPPTSPPTLFFRIAVCVGRGSRGRYIKEVVSTDVADRVSLSE